MVGDADVTRGVLLSWRLHKIPTGVVGIDVGGTWKAIQAPLLIDDEYSSDIQDPLLIEDELQPCLKNAQSSYF